MPPVINTEFYNENENRNYPFQDDSNLTDTSGRVLVNDLIVDGMLYPIGNVGVPYLKELNKSTNSITIADSANDNILMVSLAFKSLIPAYHYVSIILQDSDNRHAGNLILNYHAYKDLPDGIIYEFSPASTKFTTSCFITLAEDRVQGFKLPDGSFIKGDVAFQGTNGASVNSDNGTLEFSFIGEITTIDGSTGEDCLSDSVPIKSIRLITTDCSKVLASVYGADTIALTSRGFELEDICPPRIMSSYGTPTYEDVCDTKRYKLTYADNIPSHNSTVTVGGVTFEFIDPAEDPPEVETGYTEVLIDSTSAAYTFSNLRSIVNELKSPVFPFADNNYDDGYIIIGVSSTSSVSMTLGSPFTLEEVIEPDPLPIPTPCTGAIINDETLTVTNGMLHIITPSSPAFSNAIGVEPLHAELTAGIGKTSSPYTNVDKQGKADAKFKLTSPGILVKIKGLNSRL